MKMGKGAVAVHKIWGWLWDAAITVGVLMLSFCVGLLMQYVMDTPEHITTCFVFGVFLVSILTDGFGFGLAAALAGVLLVNYVFTFPYWAFDFISSSNFFSAVVMTAISVCTSTLTRKIKRQESIKAEGERERMRANLLRAISHDLRTPLTTIYGSSSALVENRDNLTEDQKSQMLRGIQEDAQWLVRMVENLLSVTRVDSDGFKITKTPTPLDELVDSVILKFRKRYPDQTIRLELPEELVIVSMEPMLIEQVLVNILENAVQHAEGMTELVFRVRLRHGKAVFEVEDNGSGIDPERMRDLFTGYSGGKVREADGKKHNLGIGLSVCATIIRAHGSEIQAENRPLGGAVFRFALDVEEM